MNTSRDVQYIGGNNDTCGDIMSLFYLKEIRHVLIG